MLRNALRFLAGAFAGALLWWYFAPAYDGAVASAAAHLTHLDRRLSDVDAAERGRWILLRSAGGAFPTATLPGDQLTYNAILFLGLLATVRRPSWRRVAAAVLILVASHVLTFAVAIESIYAGVRSPGSTEASVWLMAQLFLRVVGMLAIAFGCWWWVASRRRGQPSL